MKRSAISPNSQFEKFTLRIMHSASLLNESTTVKQSISVAAVLVRRAYKEKSRRSFFTLNSVETASPMRLKQSAGSEFVNSSLSEERLEMLDRLRQIIAMLEALVAVLREMYLQNKDDFCVLRRQH